MTSPKERLRSERLHNNLVTVRICLQRTNMVNRQSYWLFIDLLKVLGVSTSLFKHVYLYVQKYEKTVDDLFLFSLIEQPLGD